METEDLDPFGGPVPIPDEDSGSAYENSESERSVSDGEGKVNSRPPSPARRRRSRNSSQRARTESRDDNDSPSEQEELQDTAIIDEQFHRDAESWAADFQAPASPSEIKDSSRNLVPRSRKRKPEKPASTSRAKRLKPYQNNKYRDILNTEIHHVATRMVLDRTEHSLLTTQIGISIWTSLEKERFYSALQRLGRDDIRGIAERVESKSEQEVQQYIFLHHEALAEKKGRDGRALPLTDIPAAIEISKECCAVMEQAGDALASRQELHEEKAEKAKWGDAWLVTESVARRLDKYRRDGEGEAAVDQVLPATNLFFLRNWLELSNRVFMNPDTDDNWQDLAERQERPAIRATAFEDFHSLAFNYMKRLLQTTLFCAMSREKATGSKKVKHAEVKPDDVEAAVAILKMQKDSNEFWVKSARTNKLRVVDDESPGNEDTAMTYDEVELALKSTERARSRSRSRSVSRPAPSVTFDDHSDSSVSSLEDDDSSDDDDELNLPSTPSHENNSSNRRERVENRTLSHISAIRAEEASAEAHDMRASGAEENKMWEIMEQLPPGGFIKEDSVDEGKQPQGMRESREGENWRDLIEPMGAWETFRTPVSEEAFEKNRKRKSKRAMRREHRDVTALENGDVEDTESSEELEVGSEVESEEEHQDGESEDEPPESEQHGRRERSASGVSGMSEPGVDVKVEEWD